MEDSRRDFLKKAALLTGAATLANLIPESIQKAMAINPASGSTYMDAEHVVILMQENRSFDHMFGTLKGVRGFNDPRAIDLPDKNKVWLQSNQAGETYAPFRLDIKGTKATWMSSLPHSWANQVDARNDGKFDQWLNVKHSPDKAYADMPLTLGYYNREDIPFYYALADAFTVCDQNFCSALTGTNPNRLYFWSGTIRAEQHENSLAHVWNEDMDYATLNWATFPERLEDHNISWKHYQNEVAIDTGLKGEEDPWLSNFQDNPLEFFAQYNIKLHDRHIAYLQKKFTLLPGEIIELQKQITALPVGDAHIDHLSKQLKQKRLDLENIKKDMSSLDPGRFAALSQREKNLHQKAFTTNNNDPNYRDLVNLKYKDDRIERELVIPKGDVLHQFREDVKTGKLPTVSWLTAPENFSDHPSAAWYGAWYVSEVIDILTQDPEIWKKTIFILAYDENDGYFDHIPPFVAPHPHKEGTGKTSSGIDTSVEFVTHEQEKARNGFPQEFNRESALGLGYRVPLVIASPWTRGGWVNSEVFDHTSTLQFLEHFLSKKTGKEVVEPNISNWRRTICGDLSTVFRTYNDERIAKPAFVAKDAFVESIHKAKFKKLPSNYKLLSADEIKQINQNTSSSPYMQQQEKGIKPSCALPYQLYADGKLSADKNYFEIKFNASNKAFGDKSLGSPFNVYAPGKYASIADPGQMEAVHTWAYALKAGDSITDVWPVKAFENSGYHLRVYGPNGFFREYKGNSDDPLFDVTCEYEQNPSKVLTGNVVLKLVNSNLKQSYIVEIIDHADKNNNQIHPVRFKEQKVLVLNLAKSYRWYDFSVKITGSAYFEKRYAGRVETGNHGHSDPMMGQINI